MNDLEKLLTDYPTEMRTPLERALVVELAAARAELADAFRQAATWMHEAGEPALANLILSKGRVP